LTASDLTRFREVFELILIDSIELRWWVYMKMRWLRRVYGVKNLLIVIH
jgi:hypothetical protein